MSNTGLNNALYGNYRNRKFTDIWQYATKPTPSSANGFVEDYTSCPFHHNNTNPPIGKENTITTQFLESIYYGLYARYGNSTIANSDENQFKFKVYALIYQYAPKLMKELEIQNQLMKLNLNEMDNWNNSTQIHNHAYNPSTSPSTDAFDALKKIDDQSAIQYKKSPAEGYAVLAGLLEDDLMRRFLDRFKNLFLIVVEPEEPLWYGFEV